jgi:hypothetical protein
MPARLLKPSIGLLTLLIKLPTAAEVKAQKAAKIAELNKEIKAKQKEAQALKDEIE